MKIPAIILERDRRKAPAPVGDNVVAGDAAHSEYVKRICATKHSHPTRQSAIDSGVARVAGGCKDDLYVYKCPICSTFHLTKKKTRVLAAKGSKARPAC